MSETGQDLAALLASLPERGKVQRAERLARELSALAGHRPPWVLALRRIGCQRISTTSPRVLRSGCGRALVEDGVLPLYAGTAPVTVRASSDAALTLAGAFIWTPARVCPICGGRLSRTCHGDPSAQRAIRPLRDRMARTE